MQVVAEKPQVWCVLELELTACGAAGDKVHRRDVFAFLERSEKQDEDGAVLDFCFFGVGSEGERRIPLEIFLRKARTREASE